MRILAAVFSLLLLSSCGYLSVGSTEELLQRPSLNERQAQVYAALESTLNIEDIVYKYPQTGDYRSPFVFYDLDGDGSQEAIVFYAYNSDPSSIWAKVMGEQEDGTWYSAYDIAGTGDQIDFIYFASMLAPHEKCMVIGWKNTMRDQSSLGVYSFSKGHFQREILQPYVEWEIADFDGDGLSEIITISQDSDGFRMSLLTKGVSGGVQEVSQLRMSPDATRILQLTHGDFWNGTKAVYVDEWIASGIFTATEVVQVTSHSLISVSGHSEMANFSITYREREVLSLDVDGDGEVEVPIVQPLPAQYDTNELEELMLTEYLKLKPGGFERAYETVINARESYLIFMPEEWQDRVSVVQMPEVREWRFHAVSSTSNNPGTELLRIRVHSANDYMDSFVAENYFKLAENGSTQYFGYIPRSNDDRDLAVTQNQVKRMFKLL